MKTVKQCIGILFLSLVLAFSPCVTNVTGTALTAQAATVKINKTSATLIKGQTLKLKISGTSATVKWKSSKKSVAKVSSSGKVTAKKKGTATITATVNGKKYKCKIKVVTPSISATELSLSIGETQTIEIIGTTEDVTWKSSDSEIVTVDGSGNVLANAAGTAKITATVLGKKYKCTVTVESSASSTVYITETGAKYHRDGCRYLDESQIAISLEDALVQGYTACGVCNP